jgi:hypothetical protein
MSAPLQLTFAGDGAAATLVFTLPGLAAYSWEVSATGLASYGSTSDNTVTLTVRDAANTAVLSITENLTNLEVVTLNVAGELAPGSYTAAITSSGGTVTSFITGVLAIGNPKKVVHCIGTGEETLAVASSTSPLTLTLDGAVAPQWALQIVGEGESQDEGFSLTATDADTGDIPLTITFPAADVGQLSATYHFTTGTVGYVPAGTYNITGAGWNSGSLKLSAIAAAAYRTPILGVCSPVPKPLARVFELPAILSTATATLDFVLPAGPAYSWSVQALAVTSFSVSTSTTITVTFGILNSADDTITTFALAQTTAASQNVTIPISTFLEPGVYRANVAITGSNLSSTHVLNVTVLAVANNVV